MFAHVVVIVPVALLPLPLVTVGWRPCNTARCTTHEGCEIETLQCWWCSIDLQGIHCVFLCHAGTLPPSWGVLRNLKRCYLGGNKLQGPLPSSWSGMAALFETGLSGNALTGAWQHIDQPLTLLICSAWCCCALFLLLHHQKPQPGVCQPESASRFSRGRIATGTIRIQWSHMRSSA